MPVRLFLKAVVSSRFILALLMLLSACTGDRQRTYSSTSEQQLVNNRDLPGYVVKRQGVTKRSVVLVHGLSGDGTSTWTNANGIYWPDLMKQDNAFDDFDIYVYQYESRLFGGCLPITDVANNLRIHLRNDNVLSGHDQVVFIAHSMGGLIVRQYLLRNRDDADKVPLVMFFATPTGGSKRADVSSLLPTCAQVDDLRTIDVNSYLKSQVSDWLSSGLPEKVVSRCAFETKKSSGALTVDRSSSSLLCSKDPDALPTDHSDAVKPNTSKDLSHIIVRSALKDLPFPNAPPLTPSNENLELKKQVGDLKDRLDQRYRNRGLRENLGRFLNEGNGLLQKTLQGPPTPLPEKEGNEWYNHVRKYLAGHLDSSYEARFVSPDFGPAMSYGVPKEYESLITGIKARLAVLRRFIEELRD